MNSFSGLRMFGSSIPAARVGLGCASMSQRYGSGRKWVSDLLEVIPRALDLGVRVFDTADVYGPFSNERLVGRGLRGRRIDAVVATKCGLVTSADGTLRRDGRPEHIRAACDGSLHRLGTDVIDLLQLHRVDPEVPLEETWGGMAELVRAGKVRGLGVSHATVAELERIHAVFPVTAVQYELSLWARDLNRDVLAWCERTGTAFLAFSPLGRGFLAGDARPELGDADPRWRDPRFAPDALEINRAIVERIGDLARSIGLTEAQLSLAWVLAQSDKVVPIPSTTRPARVADNVAAAHVRLEDDMLAALADLPSTVGRMRWDVARSGS